MSPTLADLPTGFLVAITVVTVAELALRVVALVVLVRTPRERLQLGARWPWVLMILLVNLVGAVAFLAAGRRPAPADEPHPGGDPASRADDPVQVAVDLLYPGRPEPDRTTEPRS